MDQSSTTSAPTILELAASESARKTIYSNIIVTIIQRQALIIGPALAIEQARQVDGLQFDANTMTCSFSGSGSHIIDALIAKYRDFFGHAAVEVCKEAAEQYLPQITDDQIPSLLRNT